MKMITKRTAYISSKVQLTEKHRFLGKCLGCVGISQWVSNLCWKLIGWSQGVYPIILLTTNWEFISNTVDLPSTIVSIAPSNSGREYKTTDWRPWTPDSIQLSAPTRARTVRTVNTDFRARGKLDKIDYEKAEKVSYEIISEFEQWNYLNDVLWMRRGAATMYGTFFADKISLATSICLPPFMLPAGPPEWFMRTCLSLW